jgi:hypothetical protein
MIFPFNLFKRSTPATSYSRKRTPRLRLESLESRDLPSVTYFVTNTSGSASVPGSLPYAIEQADYVTYGTLNYIDFDINAPGVQNISVSSTLYINTQMVIDGTTQPGYNGSPLILVVGNANVASVFLLGLDTSLGINSSRSTIQGLDIYNYTANGITIFSNASQGDFIQDNWIGFYQDSTGVHLNGALYPSNATSTIGIQSSYNTIRYNTLNGGFNSIVMGEDPTNTFSGTYYVTNSIQHNMIGTDPTGQTTAGYGNTFDAVFLGNGASENFIGPYNVMSGNQGNTVELLGPDVNGDVVFQNFIGTNNGATANLGNAGLGVLIADGAHGNEVGGPFGGNYISGNAIGGISLGTNGFGGAIQNFVQNNIIGLNGAQNVVLGTQAVGIALSTGSTGNLITSNVIAGNTGDAVILGNASGNGINYNWLGEDAFGYGYANGGHGVSLTASSNYNYILGNIFGLNNLGTIYQAAGVVGNDIG